MKDDAQKRIVYVQAAVVFDESEFAEFVHKKTDSTSCGPNHFGKRALGDFSDDFQWLIIVPIPGDQQQCAS